MIYRCLTSSEVGLLLCHLVADGSNLEGDLAMTIEAARCWQVMVVCHNLFVARYVDADAQGSKKIKRIYSLEEEIAIEIQEGGDQFVEYLLRHVRLPSETLDEALMAIQEDLSEYNYAKALCY